MGRNIFRDLGYKDLDFSVFKNFTLKERYNAQFRLEVFNIFNHPTFANPYGASANGFSGGNNDPALPSAFRRHGRNPRCRGREPGRRLRRFSRHTSRSEDHVLSNKEGFS